MKRLSLLAITFLILLLSSCSESINCLECQCDTTNTIDIGTLPNGSHVYLDKNNLSITPDSPANINLCVSNGSYKDNFDINFGNSQLQATASSTDSNGITTDPNPCLVNNYDNNKCTVAISASTTTQPWIYNIPVNATSANGNSVQLAPLTVLVSNNATDNSKEILVFIINNTQATIDDVTKNITVTLPYGTNLTNLVASYVTTGDSISVNGNLQQSGTTINDFTNPLVYRVKAKDGTTQDYQVTVNVAPNNAKEITAFSINNENATINQSNYTISLTLPYGTDLTNLIATFNITGIRATVNDTPQISQITSNNFTNPLSYVVYAADGTSQAYQVTVTTSGEDGSGGWKILGNAGFSNAEATFVNLVIGPNGIPYVGYRDETLGLAGNATVNSFPPNTGWTITGKPGFTSNGALAFGMTIDNNNNPYVIYENDTGALISMKYNKANDEWLDYPNSSLSNIGSGADFIANDSMAINPQTQQPAFAYVNNTQIKLVQYNNVLQQWQNLKTIANGKSPVIEFDKNGILYLSYISTDSHAIYIESSGNNFSNSLKIVDNIDLTCNRYCLSLEVNPQTNIPALAYLNNENSISYTSGADSWNTSSIVNNGLADLPSLAFNKTGTPFIAFRDNSNPKQPNAATVVSLSSGFMWLPVGETQFSAGPIDYLNLVINPQTQQPFVAYQDENNAYRATVMYFVEQTNQ